MIKGGSRSLAVASQMSAMKVREYIAAVGRNGHYDFEAQDETAAIQEVGKRFSDKEWRLYEIDAVTGLVGTEVIAFSIKMPAPELAAVA
jgi:hypothetical protein